MKVPHFSAVLQALAYAGLTWHALQGDRVILVCYGLLLIAELLRLLRP
jgi:hypothetical protein